MSDFRDDGYAAVDWAARLSRAASASCRCSRRSSRASCPRSCRSSPPEQGEPFANVLRDLDELIVPALTNWQHPRFFAYFAVDGVGAGDPRRAARGDAEPGRAPLARVAGVDRARAAHRRLGAPAARPAGRLARAHRGHRVDVDARGADRRAARHRAATSSSAPSTRTRRSRRRARMLGMELRKVAGRRASSRMRTDGLELDDVAAVVATVGTTSFASVDPVRELAERAHAAGAWLHVDAAYAGSSWICEEERWSQDGVELADSLVVNPHKWLMVPMDCSLLWTSRPGGVPRGVLARRPSTCARPRTRTRSREYGPALGRRFRSLKLWAVLRCYGARGPAARSSASTSGSRSSSPSWVEADPDWELVRAAALLARRLPPQRHRRGERGDPRARERER